jgi:dTMP kinase
VLLDLDESIGRDRLKARTKYDRLEDEEQDFHARVRAAYLELAKAEPDRFLVLGAADSVESLSASIRDRVRVLLAQADGQSGRLG